MNTPQRALVRAAGLAAVWIGYLVAAPYLWPETADANIGAGLVGFGLVMLVATGWALVDGGRLYVGAAMVTWLVSAIGFAAIESVRFSVLEGARGESLPVADMIGTVIFFGVLVSIVALPATAIGASLGTHPQARRISD